jgi:hypothetical protein
VDLVIFTERQGADAAARLSLIVFHAPGHAEPRRLADEASAAISACPHAPPRAVAASGRHVGALARAGKAYGNYVRMSADPS